MKEGFDVFELIVWRKKVEIMGTITQSRFCARITFCAHYARPKLISDEYLKPLDYMVLYIVFINVHLVLACHFFASIRNNCLNFSLKSKRIVNIYWLLCLSDYFIWVRALLSKLYFVDQFLRGEGCDLGWNYALKRTLTCSYLGLRNVVFFGKCWIHFKWMMICRAFAAK